MNSNNWLSSPLSPTQSSLPVQFQTNQSHHFSLGLVDANLENPFQYHEWNVMNIPADSEVPKVADFLGVSKSEHRSDLVAFNEIQPNDSDYLFSNTGMVPVQNSSSVATSGSFEFQETGSSNIQSLTLSMGSGKVSASETSCDNSTTLSVVETAPKRSSDTFGQRTSIYRGVTRHRWTGRYEAHLWDNSCRREGQSRKGRQVYLGGYDKEDKAARAYDLAALKYWGPSTTTNFQVSNYEKELEEMKHMTRQEFVAAIRRKSSGFSRGASMYRGVTRHHQHGRWQARIGRVAGNKDLYLGTFSTEEEAAEAYDIAAIKFRGLSAVTNFDMNRYDVKSILESNTLPIGGGSAKRLKEAQALDSSRKREEMIALGSSFPYGSSSSSRLQGYSLMQHQFDQPQPVLSLHSQEITPYSHDPSFHQSNYIQTQLQLHRQNSAGSNYLHQQPHNTQIYNNILQTHPALIQGLMNMGSFPPVVENNGSSSYNTGGIFLGNSTLGVASNSTFSTGNVGELAMVKIDYDDMPAGSYGGWSGDTVQGSSAGGAFTMWNE